LWGLRPGKVVESSGLQGTAQGITYSDIAFQLSRHNGRILYQIRVALRFRKGAHNVFLNHTAVNFKNRYLSPTTSSREFAIRSNKKELPVLRAVRREVISDTMMCAVTINSMLRDLGARCRYKDIVTCYSFRRGFANAIEDKVSAPQKRQAMSHKDDATFRSYITPTISIDTHNLVRGLPEDRELVNFFRGIFYARDPGAPQPPSSSLCRSDGPLPPDLVATVKAEFPHVANPSELNALFRVVT
ncbi:hypothetical protein K458DRAFT_458101, partial [Lentithecium fluviatile CBS 122367]